MGNYVSKYYKAEEIDERLYKGTYNDAVAKGYKGTKEEFDSQLAKLGNITNDYPKLVLWSGTTINDNITTIDSSVINVIPSEIIFSVYLNKFVVFRNGNYYDSWMNKDETSGNNGQYYFSYSDKSGFTKNIFKGIDGSIWIATSNNSIEQVSYNDYPLLEWSGTTVEDVEVYNPELPLPLEVVYLTSAKNIVYDTVKKTFLCYYQSIYYYGWGNVYDFQKNAYNAAIDFTAEFTKSIFKGIDGSIWIYINQSKIQKITVSNGDIVLSDRSTMSLSDYKDRGKNDAIGVVFDARKGLFVRKNKYSGILVSGSTAEGIFYSNVGCKDPYDGKLTQKLNLLFSTNRSVDFPVFDYADTNNWYIASNGEIEAIRKVKTSLDYIGSNLFSTSLLSCTQDPKNKTSASVFYSGSWGNSDINVPTTTQSYALIDIL